MLGDQFGESALDGLAVFAAGAGVAGDGLGFQFGDQGTLAPLDVADRLLQRFPAFGVLVMVGLAGGVAGELGGQQVVAAAAEDTLGEEAVHDAKQDVFADPQAGRVAGIPARPLGVVAPVGFAGVVGQAAAGLAEHAAVAQLADHVRAQRVAAAGLRVPTAARGGTGSPSRAADDGGLEQGLGDQRLMCGRRRPHPFGGRVAAVATLRRAPFPHHVPGVLRVAQDLADRRAGPPADGTRRVDRLRRRVGLQVGVEQVGYRVVAEPAEHPVVEDPGHRGPTDRVGPQPGLGLAFGSLGRDRVRDLVRQVPVAGLADVPALLGVGAEAVPRQLQHLQHVPFRDGLLDPAGQDRGGPLGRPAAAPVAGHGADGQRLVGDQQRDAALLQFVFDLVRAAVAAI